MVKEKTRKELLDELTNKREFEIGNGKWVSGGVNHYTKKMLEDLYKGSRKKK